MEELKDFNDLATECGIVTEPFEFPEEIQNEFREFLNNSLIESRRMHAQAIESAKNTYVWN